MNEFNAICRTTGCPNFIGPSRIWSEKLEPVNVTCGSCGQQITEFVLINAEI
jgi:hypothetical protein